MLIFESARTYHTKFKCNQLHSFMRERCESPHKLYMVLVQYFHGWVNTAICHCQIQTDNLDSAAAARHMHVHSEG